MNNEELILGLVREIHDDQKDVVKSINELTIAHAELRSELEASRNGYSPYQVVQMLHWIEQQMKKEEKQHDNIKSAIISWLVPVVMSMFAAGFVYTILA